VKTRLCVADPVTLFRAGVREVLKREGDYEVIEAPDVDTLMAAVQAGLDIALIDDALPPGGVLPVLRAIKGRCPEIIVWTLRPRPDQILAALCAGATGYLRKEISAAGLVRSLRGAAKGEPPLTTEMVALMISALHASETKARAQDRAAVLSAREQEVLLQLAYGFRNQQIATILKISEFTVKRHVQNILRKLELPSRHAAAAFFTSLADTDADAVSEPAAT
jgi:two-component system, NarL family, nitrate/nitrite response regulator NarL